ncbi:MULTISPECIES: ABC transporter substrate-binding protein [unclassified Chelatococcus]|uniref:ABC transporter substrate-binding protein n=1 Tax=unclassified Chelatococcus TaxID=2638111 RepID=UPI0020BDB991|nr:MULTISPECIES: ABC transporter substrate-binding protein [unclassified Chelatococcus]MCO5075160.1 ABC transporter substrate-binding protein [Chelatococcus sp.]CAH1657802.1 Amino acid/amide ABC transporter substrate-binding protein, HAAT family [Hyphomicrobiales bacterium]CAH1689364.1 Amino acid/amide ABC transporter substrate-binding protein, HAAT family [Hyphomicrobiales bacterium]
MGHAIKALLLASMSCLALTGMAKAEDIKIGIEMGFTGPIETLTPPMAQAAELAMKEVSDSGIFLDGAKVIPVRGDETCIDAGAATAAAERLITSDKVSGIIGPTCSGAASAVLTNVAIPNGMVLISPSATSPGLSTIDGKGLFFRTAPSDAREGEILSKIMWDRGIKSAAISYTNNDYGKGIASSIQSAFEKLGGKITLSAPHEDGKSDYSAEIGALASAGGDAIIVAGYADQGGAGVVQTVLDTGAFSKFVFPNGMWGESLIKKFGKQLDGAFGDRPGSDSPGAAKLLEMTKAAGINGTATFVPETYDATAIMLLAMQAAGSAKPADYKTKIMSVVNAPGEKIYPGELAKALKILKEGGDIDYVGASAVEFIGKGESAGSYREIVVENGEMKTVKYH